ncbi:protein TolA, partial [Bordetella sp. 15P40C-2]|nr:protein TolA [Bordetella sp. 15P40C-2]
MSRPIIQHNSAAPSSPAAQDNRKALGLAILAHLLLLVALIFGVSWHTENPGPVQVELWADGVTPDARPPEEQPDEPDTKPEPQPEPEPEAEPEPAPPPPPAPEPEPQPEPPPQAPPPPT